MSTLVTLAEAASYLGVSKATLRNWDKEEKLKAHRHPLNKYRCYDLDELRKLRAQTSLPNEITPTPSKSEQTTIVDLRNAKKVISRLHAILRDCDGDSSLVERFDELTKFLFLKLVADRDTDSLFSIAPGESTIKYAIRIRNAYTQQSAIHPDLIIGKFSKLTCSDAAISQCGAALNSISFKNASFDIKGIAYEEVIRGTFDKSDHQQFFTPHQVVKFMVEMLRPLLKGTVGDPACGTAGFLAEVIRSGAPVKRIVGLEIDERLKWVSGINLQLHGGSNFEIECLSEGGTLGKNAERYFGSFDVILTNPPFGSDYSDSANLQTYELGQGRPSRRRGILFIERCWSLLQDGGILAIVIDEGVLNSSNATDVRKFILENFSILAVISLPETTFMPYANVNASILFMRKTTAKKRSENVFFARAENIGRKPNGDDDILYDETGNPRPNSDLPEILKRWNCSQGHKDLPTDDIGFITNVRSNLISNETLRLDFRYHHPSRNKSQELLKSAKYPLSALADICQERNVSIIPSSDMSEQVILYTGLANIEVGNGVAHQVPTPAASIKSAVKRYEPNDIIFARMRPNLKKIALMTFQEGGYVSPECSVLTVRTDKSGKPLIEPSVLAAVLRSDLTFGQIMHLIAGIGRPRLNTTDLRKVLIPIPPHSVQMESKADFDGLFSAAKQLRAKAQSLIDESNNLETRAVEDIANKLIGS